MRKLISTPGWCLKAISGTTAETIWKGIFTFFFYFFLFKKTNKKKKQCTPTNFDHESVNFNNHMWYSLSRFQHWHISLFQGSIFCYNNVSFVFLLFSCIVKGLAAVFVIFINRFFCMLFFFFFFTKMFNPFWTEFIWSYLFVNFLSFQVI